MAGIQISRAPAHHRAPRGVLTRALICILTLGAGALAQADDNEGRRVPRPGDRDAFSVSAGVSTLGFGADVSRSFARRLAVRAGYHAFSFDFTGTESGIDYDIDVELQSVSLGADWHPWGGGAFIGAGVLFNGNAVRALGDGDDLTVDIGDLTFPVSEVGTLSGTVAFNDVAPTVTVGWDTAFRRRFGVSVAAGVVFQGEPVVRLSADGELADNAVFQEELAREQAELQEELADFTLYPVVSFALTYRF